MGGTMTTRGHCLCKKTAWEFKGDSNDAIAIDGVAATTQRPLSLGSASP